MRAHHLRRAIVSVHGEGREDCTDCGEAIPAARRRALPSATRCIDCQEDHERRRRIRLGGR